MEGPQRLMDGNGSELERALVQELRSYRGPRDMRAHTLAAIGATAATGLSAGRALAWWSGKTWPYKLLLTVSVTSLLGAVPVGYRILRQEVTPAAQVPPTVAASESQLPLPAIEPAAPKPPAAVDEVPTSPVVARAPRSGVGTSADLRAELTALDQVRSTLVAGDFSRALTLLEAYFRSFHHGRLQLEAQILRIEALAGSGDTDAARSSAQDFLRRHPKSVHAARLQSIVGP